MRLTATDTLQFSLHKNLGKAIEDSLVSVVFLTKINANRSSPSLESGFSCRQHFYSLCPKVAERSRPFPSRGSVIPGLDEALQGLCAE